MINKISTKSDSGFNIWQKEKPQITHFCCNALVASILKQVAHHIHVILLGCHVERSESILEIPNLMVTRKVLHNYLVILKKVTAVKSWLEREMLEPTAVEDENSGRPETVN